MCSRREGNRYRWLCTFEHGNETSGRHVGSPRLPHDESTLPVLLLRAWEHYHRRSDTPEKLNYEKMARIAALLADVTLACAACDLPKATGDTDTAAFEIALLERAFGALLRLVGVQKLWGRADLDTLVRYLVGLGL